jgi:hypothetical protein
VTVEEALTALAAAALGACACLVLVRRALRSPPAALVRTNVAGRPVPAVLGGPLCLGALVAQAAVGIAGTAGWDAARHGRMLAATAVVIAALGAAGRWDDLRGDEAPRGFSGHLGAARGGRVTGGMVKLVAGGAAGLAAGAIVDAGWAILEVGLLVALTANLVNLLDRAPGRAGKATLLMAVPLLVVGDAGWAVAAAGVAGALVAALPADLGARAMLGDAGANPLGGVMGVGLAVALDRPVRLGAIVVLLGLNLLSERVSFSRVIGRTPVLRQLDAWGRNE